MKAIGNRKWKSYLEEAIVKGIINGLVVSSLTFIITRLILPQQPLGISLKSQVIALVIQRFIVWAIVKIIEHTSNPAH